MHARSARRQLGGLLLCTALLLGLLGALPAQAVGRATVIETLNVRSGPGTDHAVLTTLPPGRTVTTLGARSGWTEIEYQNGSAYVASRYLAAAAASPAPAPGAAVVSGSVRATTSGLNLRRGAATSYAVLRVLPEGARVTMTGRTAAGFAEVVSGSVKGWASLRYLTPVRGLPATVGTRVATAVLDIRTSSGATARTVAEVPKGTRLAITGATANGRAQVVYRSAARWVTARYLAVPQSALPTPPALPRVTGTRYATTTLDIRSSSAASAVTVAEVPRGTALSITGVVRNGRMQVVYNRTARWVTAKYLSSTRPGGSAGAGSAVERGLKPNAIKVHRASRARFPQITTYYGVRPDSIPDHPSGRALDIMIPNYGSSSGRALGSDVADWARANAKELGIQYVIWNQRIWNVQRNAEGWRYMADRGGDSANHKNHVHVTVYG